VAFIALGQNVHGGPSQPHLGAVDLGAGNEVLQGLVRPRTGDGHNDAIGLGVVAGAVQREAHEVREQVQPDLPLELVELVQVELVRVLQHVLANGRVLERADVQVDQPEGVGGDPAGLQRAGDGRADSQWAGRGSPIRLQRAGRGGALRLQWAGGGGRDRQQQETCGKKLVHRGASQADRVSVSWGHAATRLYTSRGLRVTRWRRILS
jgi:hypothetical protein